MNQWAQRAPYSDRLYPVFNSYVYRINDVSSASIEDVDFAMITSSDYRAVPIMKSHMTEPTRREWDVKGFQSISGRKFEDSDTLRDIVYDQSILF